MVSSRSVRVVLVATLAGLVALAGVLAAGCGSSTSSTSSSGSSSSSDVEFIALDDFDVSTYAGKPLVVNYFGSWCPPCNAEAPELSSWSQGHSDAQLVGVAVEDTEGNVNDFMGKYDLAYPIVLDPQWENANANGVTGVPETVFYDAQGKEVDRIIGAGTEAQFDLSYAKASQ
jgi:thiol-disulfide isomerase/thioredoxin